jgi:hypothetical protein
VNSVKVSPLGIGMSTRAREREHFGKYVKIQNRVL